VPGPAPGPTPTPSRVWSPSDPIWGYVLDRLSGLPIPGAVVTLYNSLGTVIQAYSTGGDGGFSFVGLPAGYYKIAALSSSYTTIPLSSYNFYYSGAQIIHNLELLSTGMPTLVLSDQPDKVGTFGYAYRTQQYVASQQKTYTGILFTAPNGSAIDFGNLATGNYTTYAEYWFSLPVPSVNDIGYEGYWITTEQYGIVSGVWGSLTQDKVERQFYDWSNYTGQTWLSIDRDAGGAFLSSTTGYVPFWAINRTTGQVLMRVCPRDPLVFVAAAKLQYDYHKITAAPLVNKVQTFGTTPNNSTYLEINENVYVNAATSSKWLPANSGIAVIPWASYVTSIPAWYRFDVSPGPGSTITVTDQAGHTTLATVP